MTGKPEESVPAPPKKPMAAFFLYKSDRYPEFVKSHPDKRIAELTKLISQDWAKEPQESKDGYQRRYLEQKKNFDAEMKAYIAQHGKPPARKRKLRKEKKAGKGGKGKKERPAAKKEKLGEKLPEAQPQASG